MVPTLLADYCGFLQGHVSMYMRELNALPGLADPAGGLMCNCDKTYLPVTCTDGKPYANKCLAKCAGAEGCQRGHDGKAFSLAVVFWCYDTGRQASEWPAACLYN